MSERLIATAHSWKCQAFTAGESIPYRAAFSVEEFIRLQAGLIPRAMEDKWFVFYEEPFLFFHRSWTGQAVYRVKLSSVESGMEVAEALWSQELAAAAEPANAKYQARLLDFLISNLLLGKQISFPQPESAGKLPQGLFQHHIAGSAFPERSD